MASTKVPRRSFLQTAVAGVAAAQLPAEARPPAGVPDCGSVWERPPRQTGNNLNLIVIASDTFRHDNLACYGPKWLENLETPNLDRFASESVVFKDAYPEGMPTIVIRRTLYTGRRVIPCYYFPQPESVQLPGWHAMYNEDVTLSETLLEAGYVTALISDLYHQFKPTRNFNKGFHTWRWVRGQESDYYGTSPHQLLDVSDMVSAEYMDRFPYLHQFLSQYKANRNLWKQAGEALSQLVAQEAIRWLNHNFEQRPFYLQVECFDSHEPWDPPRRFLEKYMPGATGPSFIEPPYDTVPVSDEIKQRFRANYAGEVSCVDYWLGNLLATIRELGLFDNSIVVFMSDHGAMLGERGQFLKGPDKLRGQVTHVPLIIHTPGDRFAGRRVSGFCQIPDVMPTLLDSVGLKPPSRVTGTNLWPIVTGERSAVRDYVVQTYGWVGAARSREWNYSEVWKPDAHAETFHLQPGVPAQAYQPQLYDLEKDPNELTNVADRYPDVCKQMSGKLKEYIASGQGLTYGSFNQKVSLNPGEVYVSR